MLTRHQPTGNRQGATTPPTDDFPQHIVEELEAVVNEIQAFVQNFCDRFETLTTQASTWPADITAGDESPAESPADWQAKRLHTEQKIREQVDMLTNAWLRLEDEQRILLQTKQGLANELQARVTTFGVGSTSILQCRHGNSQSAAKSEHSPVQEFERLRHEIQSSRPNIKSQ